MPEINGPSAGEDTKPAANKGGGRSKRVNPNTPLSEAEKRKALEETNTSAASGPLRQNLPDDVEKLKDMVVALDGQVKTSDKEITDLRHEQTQSRHKVENYDKIKKQLAVELKNTEQKWMPAVGFQNEELAVEVMAAPLGDPGRPVFAMLMFFVEGKLEHTHVTSEKIVMGDDQKGRWLLK